MWFFWHWHLLDCSWLFTFTEWDPSYNALTALLQQLLSFACDLAAPHSCWFQVQLTMCCFSMSFTATGIKAFLTKNKEWCVFESFSQNFHEKLLCNVQFYPFFGDCLQNLQGWSLNSKWPKYKHPTNYFNNRYYTWGSGPLLCMAWYSSLQGTGFNLSKYKWCYEFGGVSHCFVWQGYLCPQVACIHSFIIHRHFYCFSATQ